MDRRQYCFQVCCLLITLSIGIAVDDVEGANGITDVKNLSLARVKGHGPKRLHIYNRDTYKLSRALTDNDRNRKCKSNEYKLGEHINRASGQRKRVNRHLPRVDYQSELYVNGDPDEGYWQSRERVARIHSGNVGFFRPLNPSWYVPCAWNASTFVALPKNRILLDDHFFKNKTHRPERGQRLRIDRFYHQDGNFTDGYRKMWGMLGQRGQYSSFNIELVASLASGFHVFNILDDIKYPVNNWWKIKWGDYDRHNEPYIGCFAFKNTAFQAGKNGFYHVNSEIPIRVEHYDDREGYYYANKASANQSPFYTLDGSYNDGSPVFCGIRGELKFFARHLNQPNKYNCTIKLIPLEVIIKEMLNARAKLGDVQNKLMMEIPVVDIPFQPPVSYRGLYRARGVQEKLPSATAYAGTMLILNEWYFVVDDKVAEMSLDPRHKSSWSWEYRHSRNQHLNKISNFHPTRQPVESQYDLWPIFQTKIPNTNLSLYKRAYPDTSWAPANSKFDLDLNLNTLSDCRLILSNPVKSNSDNEDLVDTVGVPVHLVPSSCSSWFCYFLHNDKGDANLSWRLDSPIVCGSKPAFMPMQVDGRPPEAGKLALSFNYILEQLRTVDYDLYKSLVLVPRSPNHPIDLPSRVDSSLLPPIVAQRWFRPLLSNSPQRDDSQLGFAGLATVLTKRRFLVSDFVANNAFFPTISNHTYDRLLATFFHDQQWIYEAEDANRPRQMAREIPRYTGAKRPDTNKIDFPRREIFITNHAFQVMSRDIGFHGNGFPPRFRDLDEADTMRLTMQKEPCYALTYVPQDGRLVLKQIPLLLERCDSSHCYFNTHHDLYNPNSDLSKGVHAGVPVFCGINVIGFNEPYADQLNRAIYRVLRQSVMMSNAYRKPVLGEVVTDDPPIWYRNLFSEQLITLTDEDAYLDPIIVLSPKYLISRISARLDHHERFNNLSVNYALFKSLDEPTPSTTVSLYDHRTKHKDDNIELARQVQYTVFDILRRNPAFEPLNRTLDKLYKEGMESTKDCYVYFYRNEPIGTQYHIFRFVKTFVEILECIKHDDGRWLDSCFVKFHNVNNFKGPPIACGGVLSYILDISFFIRVEALNMTNFIRDLKLIDKNPLPDVTFIDPPE